MLAKFDGVRPIFHAEPEAPATQVSLTSISAYTKEPDTAALHIKRLPRMLALAMLNRRFSILSKKANSVFRFVHVSVGEGGQFAYQIE